MPLPDNDTARSGAIERAGSRPADKQIGTGDRSRLVGQHPYRQATWTELDRSGHDIDTLAVGAVVLVHPDPTPRPRPCICHRLASRVRHLTDRLEEVLG